MKDFKKLREEALRQAHRQNDVISEGDIVMSARTGDKGHSPSHWCKLCNCGDRGWKNVS